MQKEQSYKFGIFIYVPVCLYVASYLKNGWISLVSQADFFVFSFNEHLFNDLLPVSERISNESTWNLVYYENSTKNKYKKYFDSSTWLSYLGS